MRIALVCPYAWDRPGGVQSHIRSLAAVLRRHDHETEVWAPAADPAAAADAGVRIMGRSVNVPANGSIAPLSFGPAGLVGLRRAMRDLAPEVLHLHEPLVPSLSLQALVLKSAPAVGTFHAAADSSLGYRLGAPVLRQAAARLDVRIAVSEAARDLVLRHVPGRYDIVPNGIDVERFRIKRRRVPRSILFVGRLEPRKGLEILLRAVAAIDNVSLVVVGTGPGEEAARALASELGVEVVWRGRLDDVSLAEAFASATLFCAPNLGGESFGIVLLEAMAAGTPVVCSDLPAFRTVGQDAVETFPVGDPSALRTTLLSLLHDPARRRALAARGRRRVTGFDWETVAGELESRYEEARQKVTTP